MAPTNHHEFRADPEILDEALGPLTAQQQERFLERPETDQLQAYSVRVVQDAIGSQKRLKDILGEA